MCLRARNGPPSVRPRAVKKRELVRAMTYRKLGALVAVGAIALVFATNETVARGAVAAGPRAGFAHVRPVPHLHHGLHAFRHHGRFGRFNDGGFFWPGSDDAFGAYTPSAEPVAA